MLGLRKVPEFEQLIQSDTFDFDDKIMIYNRSALNFSNSFYAPKPLDEDIMDNKHDDAHAEVLARMYAAAHEHHKQQDRNQDQARQVFRENLSQHQPVHHLTPESFAAKIKSRTEQWKQNGEFDYRKEVNRLRQEVRQSTDRQRDLNERRQPQPQNFDISEGDSPPPSPNTKMQGKYAARLAKATGKRKPTIKKPNKAPTPNTRLDNARALAGETPQPRAELQSKYDQRIAKGIAMRNPNVYKPSQTQRNNDRLDQARGRVKGPIGTTPQ
jgi:hypothetical protein